MSQIEPSLLDRTEDVADPPPAETGSAAPRHRTSRRLPVILAGLLVVALVGAGLLAWQWSAASSAQDDLRNAQRQVLDRATSFAANLTTYNYQDLASQQKQINDASTDAFQSKFAETNKSLAPLFAKLNAVAHGKVLDSGIASLSGGSAVVVLFVDQEATSSKTPTPATQSSRLRMTLVKRADVWLVDTVDLV